jgi:hypothetical protein
MLNLFKTSSRIIAEDMAVFRYNKKFAFVTKIRIYAKDEFISSGRYK